MADPLSVAGLVTGVISLGLQVAGGLVEYLDAVKGRKEELNSVKQQATEMKDFLLTVKDLLPQLERRWPASATVITRHVGSCDSELSALHALLSELSHPDSSGLGIRDKFAEKKKKLTYPFNRAHITRLEERLTKVNNALQTALQVTDLNISTTSASRIDQIYDLVLSLSQSQVTQTQSASFTATLRSPGRASPMGSMSVEAAVSLASKPSLLSSSIETLERYDAEQAPCSNISQICSCPKLRKTSYRQSRWGYLSLSYGTSSTRRHLPDCPFSQFDGETQATKFTVEYSGLRRLFQTAVKMSLSSTQGAGGRSIGTGFTYYPIVDELTAPAFRILKLAYRMNFWRGDEGYFKSCVRTLQYCFNSIFILYSQNRASPKDIDSYGESLIQLAAEILILLSGGMKAHTMNSTPLVGSSIYPHSFERVDRMDDYLRFAKLLLPAEPDISILTSQAASGCGPLSLAARAGDDKLVRDLLKRLPQSLEEVNDFGHTPVHLAVNHPSCLHLILDAGGSSMLEKIDWSGESPLAWSEESPLAWAIRIGCRTSVQTLLAAGCPIHDLECLNGHRSCTDDVLVGLKQRRDELKALALEYLTEAEAKSFELHENKILDGNAFKVQRLLMSRGIDVPLRLCVVPPCYRDEETEFTSIYHSWMVSDILNELWALGFRDVNCINPYGQVPLMQWCYSGWLVWWLIEHGADYWTPFSERSDSIVITVSVTPAHFLFYSLGKTLLSDFEDSDSEVDEEIGEEIEWIVEKLIQVRTSDTCSCLCSVGGCTPWKAFFDSWRGFPSTHTPERLVQQWMSSLPTLQTSLDEDDLKAALRRMTFDALGLTHTCCDFREDLYYQKSLRTPEEVDEINSEQSSLLNILHDLLNELNQIADEDRGGTPLIVDEPEEFWMRRWLPRITETLDKLDGDDLTAEERLAAEAIGVVWGPLPASTPISTVQRLSPDDVMKEVEKIMSEQIK
ncbi:hypothetical protein F5Y03DRAFT_388847 [Xylaria venustula]|nr:hypothetical protein F5Y03DRAFT_388847 [Xylaria venustula]